MPRGNVARGRGRGRGSTRGIQINSRNDRESALNRLDKVVYPRAVNDRNARKYKFTRSDLCIVRLPVEDRIKVVTKKFLKTYYDIFDLPGRPNLESQYNSDAFFSFSSTPPLPVGRNLLEVRDPSSRVSLLIHDKKNIAQAFSSFSPTKHQLDKLTIDLPYYIANPMSVTSMQLVVTGKFTDTSSTTNTSQAFTRVFVIKQTSMDKEGEPVYEIFNDLFMLQPPAPEQATSGDPASRSKEDMIKSIMARTRMNRVGSTRLLMDCTWNEEESMAVFNKLLTENKIPQEFFTV